MIYDTQNNDFIKEVSLKYPVSVNDKIDIMDNCLIYYPGIIYFPGNKEGFISACVINTDGQIVREQVPEMPVEAKRLIWQSIRTFHGIIKGKVIFTHL